MLIPRCWPRRAAAAQAMKAPISIDRPVASRHRHPLGMPRHVLRLIDTSPGYVDNASALSKRTVVSTLGSPNISAIGSRQAAIGSASSPRTPERDIILGRTIRLSKYISQRRALGFACDELVAGCARPCLNSSILVPYSRTRRRRRSVPLLRGKGDAVAEGRAFSEMPPTAPLQVTPPGKPRSGALTGVVVAVAARAAPGLGGGGNALGSSSEAPVMSAAPRMLSSLGFDGQTDANRR